MPLFEYRCDACAHLEEVLQKHSDPAPEACPRCGQAGTMHKAMSLTSFQLKGGGWYKDLYSSASSGAPSATPSPSTESKPAESKPAESKPAESKPAESKPASETKSAAPASTGGTSTASA